MKLDLARAPLPHVEGRPFAGAWIETWSVSRSIIALTCRPFAGAWIETFGPAPPGLGDSGRPFAGAWIET